MKTVLGNPALLLFVVPFSIIATFFIAFALKIAYLESKGRLKRPDGFEVKQLPGGTPGGQQKETHDHG